MPLDVSAEVLSNRRLSSDYNVLTLAAPDIAEVALPGQFVMVKPGDRLEPYLRRPFSVFEIIRDSGAVRGLSVLSKRIGKSTRQLYDANPGDSIQCLGPLGRPFVAVSPPSEAWMVAGGVGLAPFATLAEALRSKGVSSTLYYGARSARELFFLDWFAEIGVRLVLTTEDGSQGERGRVTLPLERDLTSRPNTDPLMIYACGPEAMLAAVARLAIAHKRPSQVSVERVMGCGMGGCYSCVIPIIGEDGHRHHVRSCLSGPVFRGDEIAW